VRGKVEGIVPTLCCVHCCTGGEKHCKSKKHTEYHCGTEVYGVKCLGCDWHEMNTLNYKLRQPRGSSVEPGPRLYLYAEMKFLAERKKIRELEKQSGIRLKHIDPVIRHFLLGDYLRCDDETDTIETVLKRCRVLERVTEIAKFCDRAHPGAAFDFCLSNPTKAGVKEFQELKEKMNLAFHLERGRIFRSLNLHKQFELLRNSALRNDYLEYWSRDWLGLVRVHLTKQVSRKTADEIMRFPGCQKRLERISDASVVAGKLLDKK